MSLNRLYPQAPLDDEGGRYQLQVTLDLISKAISTLRTETAAIEDRIPPAAIAELPLASDIVKRGRKVGDIFARSKQDTPSGTLECNAQAVSRTTYEPLFDLIGVTYGVGDGSTTFNVPDLRGRHPVGLGTGDASNATAWTLAAKKGDEKHALSEAELAGHSHTITHTHTIAHIHGVPRTAGGGGGSNYVSQPAGPSATPADYDILTGGTSTPDSGGSSAANTGSTGSTTAHNTLQPSLGLAYYIQASETGGQATIHWGGVPAVWNFDDSLPLTSVLNVQLAQNAIVRATLDNGTEAGNSSDIKVTGTIRCPTLFLGWAPAAFSLKNRVEITGAGGGTSAILTLRIHDPLAASGYLASTATRTINEAGGSISDGSEKTLSLSAEDLGDSWAAGYPLKFELEIQIPQTFTQAKLDLGLLTINWE